MGVLGRLLSAGGVFFSSPLPVQSPTLLSLARSSSVLSTHDSRWCAIVPRMLLLRSVSPRARDVRLSSRVYWSDNNGTGSIVCLGVCRFAFRSDRKKSHPRLVETSPPAGEPYTSREGERDGCIYPVPCARMYDTSSANTSTRNRAAAATARAHVCLVQVSTTTCYR